VSEDDLLHSLNGERARSCLRDCLGDSEETPAAAMLLCDEDHDP
jgi:hypothetical protein